ncbi:sporulation integral membrane protein YtvI [Fusibacter bizertensis]
MNVFVSKISFVVLFVALIILSLWLSVKAFFIIIPFIISYLLSKPLTKLTRWLNKKLHIPFGILTMIVVLLFVTTFITVISFAVYKLAISLSGFSEYISLTIDKIQNFTSSLQGIKIALPWLDEPLRINDMILQVYNLIFKSISNFTNTAVDSLLGVIKTIPIILFFFFFLFISLYFFIKDQDRVRSALKNGYQKITSSSLKLFINKMKEIFINYLKAQLILVSITFIISLIALTILKVPFSPLVALGIAFVDFIPMVGPAFVYMPWIGFTLVFSEYSTGIGLLIAYLVTTLTRQIIEPKIVSSKIGTHPLITIISMYTCYKIFGVFGFILGAVLVMLGIISWNTYKELKGKDEHSTNI